MTESQPADAFRPGDVLNNTYRIEAILGRGGTSEVYRARSEINGRVLALKVLNAAFSINDDFLALMIREEEIREVRHDAVVRYSEIGRSQDGHVYLVMDYVPGVGLDQKLRAGGMPAEDLLILARRVAQGLVATHAHNIVHRDLSPDNIILRNDDPAAAVIIDYGIAKDVNPGAATIIGNEFAGKYAYAAPEQLSGKADARSDVYALGAVLLALFRGRPPDVGRTPMEVIQRKAQPLDASGLPEPLKSLIERMTQPDPDRRFQTAAAVIEAIAPIDATRTVLAPRSEGRSPPMSAAVTAAPSVPGRRRAAPVLAALAALLLIAGGGAYLSGALDPWLSPAIPTAAPYTLVVEKTADGRIDAVGHMPSAAAKSAFDGRIAALGGVSDLQVAAGDVPADWGARLLDLVAVAEPLDEWRIAATGLEAQVAGLAADRPLRDAVAASLAGLSGASGLEVVAKIGVGPRILDPARVAAVLDSHADCGALRQVAPPAEGYPLGAEIVVSGSLASEQSRAALVGALDAVIGDRTVALDADTRNAPLCLVQSRLPSVPSGGFGVSFSDGKSGAANADGVFPAGSNPAIDVTIPASVVEGALWVAVVDLGGTVFHLLPNSQRPGNSIGDLRAGRSGDVQVRVAYSLEEAKGDPSRLAFVIDENQGASEILVIFYTGDLFAQMRPTSETAEAFTEAIEESLRNPGVRILAMSSRILTSR